MLGMVPPASVHFLSLFLPVSVSVIFSENLSFFPPLARLKAECAYSSFDSVWMCLRMQGCVYKSFLAAYRPTETNITSHLPPSPAFTLPVFVHLRLPVLVCVLMRAVG